MQNIRDIFLEQFILRLDLSLYLVSKSRLDEFIDFFVVELEILGELFKQLHLLSLFFLLHQVCVLGVLKLFDETLFSLGFAFLVGEFNVDFVEFGCHVCEVRVKRGDCLFLSVDLLLTIRHPRHRLIVLFPVELHIPLKAFPLFLKHFLSLLQSFHLRSQLLQLLLHRIK